MKHERITVLILSALIFAPVTGCRRSSSPAKAAEAESSAGEAKRQEGASAAAGEHEKDRASPDRIELGEQEIQSLKLVVVKAEVKELAPALQVSAELVPNPDRRADVGSRASGRVVEFRVKVGDRVSRGSPLVILESPEVGRARADLVSATARAGVAHKAFARERALLEARATSQRELQEAEAAMKTTAADLAAVRTRLATLGASSGEEASQDPARTVLRSPIRGTVVARRAHIGKSVEPSETLVEIIDLDELWLTAQVYEREMRFLARGQPVQLETKAFPGEVFRGQIDYVGETLDEKTRAVAVRVHLPNPGHRLKPGMFATARIIGTRANEPRQMLVIPWAAVQDVDGHPSVFVRDGGRAFELKKIHSGERSGDQVEVLNGIKPGEEVVGEGSFLLKGELLKATLGEEE
jgi:cobalt-zinc-cadmium efflux system membrane fusion protein